MIQFVVGCPAPQRDFFENISTARSNSLAPPGCAKAWSSGPVPARNAQRFTYIRPSSTSVAILVESAHQGRLDDLSPRRPGLRLATSGGPAANSSHSLCRAARKADHCQLSPVAQGIVAKSALSTDNLRPSPIAHGFGSACRTCSSGPGMRVAPLGFREEQP